VHEGRAFLLAIEIKDRSPATYDTLMHTLYRYGALWMSRQDAAAPVEIVLVGWHPEPVTVSSDSLPGIQHRLTHPTALDAASLDPRVRLLSVDYGKTIGRWWRRAATRTRWLETMRTSKRHTPHRLLRVHNVPPDSLVYEMLFAAGTDLIGTKQLEATARLLKARRAPSP